MKVSRILVFIFCGILIQIPSLYSQNNANKVDQFKVPQSSMEVSLNGNIYQVLKNGIQHQFKQRNNIQFRDFNFDPLKNNPTHLVPKYLQNQESLKSSVKENAYIVQFKTQAFEGYQKEIEKLGAKIYTPIPNHSLIINSKDDYINEIRELPYVRWVGPYYPAYKLESTLKSEVQLKKSEAIRYSILVLDKSLQKQLSDFIQQIGGKLELKTTSNRFEARLTGAQLIKVAQRKEVLYIDKWTPISDDMSQIRETQGINYIEEVTNFTGQGVNAEVADGGVYLDHGNFKANPPLIHGQNNSSDEHGTPVFGIVFGSVSNDGKAKGILPDAKTPIFASRYHISDRYAHTAELVDPAGNYRAVFQTNSWGSELTKDYSTISAELDQIAFDHDLLILQSQSNEGNQDSRPQAWSKNVVSVGGLRHYNTATRSDDAWDGSASIGPASDGRIKPDLANFYDYVWTAKTEGAYGQFSGTSSATPITAGHFGLLFQMWAEGIFDGNPDLHRNVFDSRPHMTTAKAMMINMADQYEFDGSTHDKTRTHQGWGLPNVKNVYQNAKSNQWSLGLIVDENDLLLPLDEKTYDVEVDGRKPLKITLVYADPPGSPGASKHLINDLTLKVISPNGDIYWGNWGLKDGNWSDVDGEANHIDNVENIFIKEPETGNWQITIIAEEVVADGHVETEVIDADFALIVSGDKSELETQFQLHADVEDGDSLIFDPPGGVYEVGETVVVTNLPKEGYRFMNWEGDAKGSENPLKIVMDANKSIRPVYLKMDSTFGFTDKFNSLTSTPNRRALPLIVPYDGKITSISMYHNGGSKNMILGVYDGTESTPINLLGLTSLTKVSPNDGWQTIELESPVSVSDSQLVWLAWLYQENPGIYYTDGSPGRVESGFPWSNGMPELWGDTAKSGSSIYSIYANFVLNEALIARINGLSSTVVNNPLQLNSDSSLSPEGNIVSYLWDFGDGTTSEEANPIHSYTSANTYNISLKITDDLGSSHTSIKEVIITDVNQIPIAVANGPYTGSVDSTITFSKQGSNDPGGSIIAYFWSFGDGNTSLLANPTHVYSEAGEFDVTLTIADGNGKIDVDSTKAIITDITLSDNLFHSKDNGFIVYPNPVRTSNIKIVLPENDNRTEYKIRVLNIHGLLVDEFFSNEPEYILNLAHLANGMYLISVQTQSKLMGSKIIIMR